MQPTNLPKWTESAPEPEPRANGSNADPGLGAAGASGPDAGSMEALPERETGMAQPEPPPKAAADEGSDAPVSGGQEPEAASEHDRPIAAQDVMPESAEDAVRSAPEDAHQVANYDDDAAAGEDDEEDDDEEELLVVKKKLDMLTEYLRRVYNFCLFCVFESDSVHELIRKCPGGHLRRPRAGLSTAAKAAARASALGDPFPSKKDGKQN
ncbi:MAG: hypothetical protein M1823_006699, partial [Watsoniomyces obsoletus]